MSTVRPKSLLRSDAPATPEAAPEKPEGGVLVGSYCWGQDARRLGSLPHQKRAETVVKVLKTFPHHDKLEEYLVDDEGDRYASISWDAYPWSRGAFCFMQPGDLGNYYHAAIQPEGNLHFAGEHCSLDQAWIQGAIKSSLRAIQEIVDQD